MVLSPDTLQHKPLKEEIFETLHQRVITGVYKPGEWLRQEDLADQLGVSMTPVREALDLLAASGLAERVPYRGVRVVELAPGEIVEAYGKRLLLECLSARLAAACITQLEIKNLQRILGEMEGHFTLKELSSTRQLSREFHLSVVRAAGDSLLLRLYTIVSNSFPDWMLYEAMVRQPDLMTCSLEEEHTEHKALLSALIEHDPEKSVHQAMDHILHMGRHLESLLQIPARALREQEQGVMPFFLQN